MPGEVSGAGQAASPQSRFGAPQPAVAPPAEAANFARMLQSYMASQRAQVQDVRSEIAALRNGGALRSGGVRGGGVRRPSFGGAQTPAPSASSYGLTYSRFGGEPAGDPFGWRSLTRTLGDSLVAPGFGGIFERQIAQESGFDPEVVFGLRTSSAGAEGIAQLMPEYYPWVDRSDPETALVASAGTMRHYLTVFDGDVRKALASYNAGLGRVQSLIRAHGDDWERALPEETRRYLQGIVGASAYVTPPDGGRDRAVFGGRGPGGVLVSPLDRVFHERLGDAGALSLLAQAGALVRAPADGRVIEAARAFDGQGSVVIDHGNGWRTTLSGLNDLLVAQGEDVRRGALLGTLAAAGEGPSADLSFELRLNGEALDPRRYLLGG